MFVEYRDRIEANRLKLRELLRAPRLKYSDWSSADISKIRDAAGVYHFFELSDDGGFVSAYVGKGGIGKNKNWGLRSRLRQHFQPSQRHALLGKASVALKTTPTEVKLQFISGSMHLQWLTFPAKHDVPFTNQEEELRLFECFAISILRPKYTAF